MSSPFGVGNASFRTRVTDAFVETVPFGFWKREAFGRFGMFDEQLIRNQDDEFNYRTIRMGGRIYQSVRIHSRYFVRDSFRNLFRQYYQYGYYKPLVLKKVGQVVKARHLAPVPVLWCTCSRCPPPCPLAGGSSPSGCTCCWRSISR
ncbi:MAG: hypothetical protein H6564_20875 [Lewinellaceae bacterium]|nr:hypothetical protein [Lewinellaceae bacterium]